MVVPAPRKYPQELRERVIRLVREARQEAPELSLDAAVVRIGARVGVNATPRAGGASMPRSSAVGVRVPAA